MKLPVIKAHCLLMMLYTRQPLKALKSDLRGGPGNKPYARDHNSDMDAPFCVK